MCLANSVPFKGLLRARRFANGCGKGGLRVARPTDDRVRERDDVGHECSIVVVNDAEAAMVRRIFREHAVGKCYSAIAKGLNRDFTPHKEPGIRRPIWAITGQAHLSDPPPDQEITPHVTGDSEPRPSAALRPTKSARERPGLERRNRGSDPKQGKPPALRERSLSHGDPTGT